MRIRIKKLSPDAALPEYAHGPAEDAGMDLRAIERATLHPHVPVAVPTGIAIELSPGYEAQVRPRSGLALKHAITLPNSPATIDPGYRGEIRVIMLTLGPGRAKGMRALTIFHDTNLAKSAERATERISIVAGLFGRSQHSGRAPLSDRCPVHRDASFGCSRIL